MAINLRQIPIDYFQTLPYANFLILLKTDLEQTLYSITIKRYKLLCYEKMYISINKEEDLYIIIIFFFFYNFFNYNNNITII